MGNAVIIWLPLIALLVRLLDASSCNLQLCQVRGWREVDVNIQILQTRCALLRMLCCRFIRAKADFVLFMSQTWDNRGYLLQYIDRMSIDWMVCNSFHYSSMILLWNWHNKHIFKVCSEVMSSERLYSRSPSRFETIYEQSPPLGQRLWEDWLSFTGCFSDSLCSH